MKIQDEFFEDFPGTFLKEFLDLWSLLFFSFGCTVSDVPVSNTLSRYQPWLRLFHSSPVRQKLKFKSGKT